MENRRTGTKLPLKLVHVWGVRIRLQVARNLRDLALFDLALDSKLRACDLVALRISDLASNAGVRSRVMILQRKTGRPVQFEVTEQTRRSIADWLDLPPSPADEWIFPSRNNRDAQPPPKKGGAASFANFAFSASNRYMSVTVSQTAGDGIPDDARYGGEEGAELDTTKRVSRPRHELECACDVHLLVRSAFSENIIFFVFEA